MLDGEARGLRIVDNVGLRWQLAAREDRLPQEFEESKVAHRQRNALFVQPPAVVGEQAVQ
ncbi:Uncharacterised protein [Mycobacterium tuberculosis]|nr:Uncharacterised protein [Mycobacterium tuberculosis]